MFRTSPLDQDAQGRDGELLAEIDDLPIMTPSVHFTPDGNNLMGINLDGHAYLWSTSSWRLTRRFEESQPELGWSMALSPDGRLLATGGMDIASAMNPSNLIIWDLESGESVRTIRLPHQVLGIDFSKDGSLIAVASLEDGVRLWEVSWLLTD